MTFAEQPISGSPFLAQVVDPTKVKVSELRSTLVNQDVSVLGMPFSLGNNKRTVLGLNRVCFQSVRGVQAKEIYRLS